MNASSRASGEAFRGGVTVEMSAGLRRKRDSCITLAPQVTTATRRPRACNGAAMRSHLNSSLCGSAPNRRQDSEPYFMLATGELNGYQSGEQRLRTHRP